MNALEAADTITVTLPIGVFSGTPSPGSLTAPFDVTPGAKTAGSIHTITITDMTASGTVSQSIIKVKTTKEPSESSIMII